MFTFTRSLVSLAALASLPAAFGLAIPRATPRTLAQAQVDSLTPLTHFAGAAYCPPAATTNWSCAACQNLPDFEPTASGGDGGEVQFWVVGFSPSLDTVLVGHQGTDFGEIEAIVTDANIARDNLDPVLFPGVPSTVKAHGGFLDAHARAAPDVMAAVKATMTRTGTNKITVSSHSLGAALGLLDAVMFKQQIPDAEIKFVGYGMPRVGNAAFATFVDTNIRDVTRVVNQQDPVPILPGRFLGFRHPSGEVHIGETGQFLACDGQESEEVGCTIDDTRFIFEAEANDHRGPYNGLQIGSASC